MARVNEFEPGDKTRIYCHFDSVDDMAEYSASFAAARYNDRYGSSSTTSPMRHDLSGEKRFYGDDCPTVGSAYTMARDGWERHLDDTVDVARHAVETVEQETTTTGFRPIWDVAGSIVDVGEYLAGVPECMIEYPPTPVTKVGRVVTLCASVSYSSSINAKTLVERGKVITAFAMELERLGIGLELYADFSSSGYGDNGPMSMHARTLVKGPNDILDPAKVLFAYAHPGMLRVLSLTAMHGLPAAFKDALNVGGGYGMPKAPKEDLPDGTIYLPEIRSNHDVPKAADELRRLLTEIGLINA